MLYNWNAANALIDLLERTNSYSNRATCSEQQNSAWGSGKTYVVRVSSFVEARKCHRQRDPATMLMVAGCVQYRKRAKNSIPRSVWTHKNQLQSTIPEKSTRCLLHTASQETHSFLALSRDDVVLIIPRAPFSGRGKVKIYQTPLSCSHYSVDELECAI